MSTGLFENGACSEWPVFPQQDDQDGGDACGEDEPGTPEQVALGPGDFRFSVDDSTGLPIRRSG
jgi:hypothetical protein